MPKAFRKKADEQLLKTLACGATVEQAAPKCRLSERTVYRRLEDPAFGQRLREVVAEMVRRMAGMLTASGAEAVKTFLALLKESFPPATRLAAARAIVELGMRVRENSEVEERLAALEQQVRQNEESRGGRR